MNRRTFLARSAAHAVGVLLIKPADVLKGQTLANLQPAHRHEQAVQHAGAYLEGAVAVAAPHRLEIATRDNQIITLVTTADTEVWEGRWVNIFPAQTGDKITAWGIYQSAKRFIVEKLYINLVNLVGPASSILRFESRQRSRITLTVDDRYVGRQRVCIMPDTLIGMATLPKKTPFKDMVLQLHSGQSVEVIGRHMRNGVVFATDVLLNA